MGDKKIQCLNIPNENAFIDEFYLLYIISYCHGKVFILIYNILLSWKSFHTYYKTYHKFSLFLVKM